MICHTNRPEGFRVSDGFCNVLITARFTVGDLPQRRPDRFLKRRSVQPARKIKRFARPGKIFVQLPEYYLCQLIRRVGLCVCIGVFERRDRAVLPIQLNITHRRRINSGSLHGT